MVLSYTHRNAHISEEKNPLKDECFDSPTLWALILTQGARYVYFLDAGWQVTGGMQNNLRERQSSHRCLCVASPIGQYWLCLQSQNIPMN